MKRFYCKFYWAAAREREQAMIISMKLHSTREEIDEVTGIVKHFGYKVHSIEGEERVVIGVVGVGDVTACMESWKRCRRWRRWCGLPRRTNL